MQEFMQYIGAPHQPDKFREFAMGTLMQAGGDIKMALLTMKAMSALPPVPPTMRANNVQQQQKEAEKEKEEDEEEEEEEEEEEQREQGGSTTISAAAAASFTTTSATTSTTSASSASSALSASLFSAASATASAKALARRTSSRERIKINVLPMPEGHDLPMDYMSPNWATAVITGLGRLLVPYTTIREARQRGGGGGLGRRSGNGAEEDAVDTSSDYCGVCKRGGKLLICDHCDSSFHLKCVGLKSTPRGKWTCMPCRQREQMAEYIHQEPGNTAVLSLEEHDG